MYPIALSSLVGSAWLGVGKLYTGSERSLTKGDAGRFVKSFEKHQQSRLYLRDILDCGSLFHAES